MEQYLEKLIAIQNQVGALIAEIQGTMRGTPEIKPSAASTDAPKKRGRPAKKVSEEAKEEVKESGKDASAAIEEASDGISVEKKKRTLSDEHKQKMKEGRERAKAKRDAEKAASEAAEKASVEEAKEEVKEEAKPKPRKIILQKKTVKPVEEPKTPTTPECEELIKDVPDSPMTKEANIYKYLFELQESGETNMLGAGPYLQRRFGFDKKRADAIMVNYMENYERLYEQFGPK